MAWDTWARRKGLPPRFINATVEAINGQVRHVVFTYGENLCSRVLEGRGLTVLGSVGTGKSCILAVVLHFAYDLWAEEPRPSALYADCGELVRALIRRELQERADELRSVPLLLLDEFGSEYQTEYSRAALDEFLRWRHGYERATCVASNLSEKAIREDGRLTRIWERLKETCEGIELGGPSRRGD